MSAAAKQISFPTTRPESPRPVVKTMQLEARELQIHPHAQRQLLPSRLKKLKEELDLDAIGTLHVVRYEINGATKYWIVDGQHRWQALMDHGFGEWPVTVALHCDVTDDSRAAKLFLQLNDRSPVSPFDKFDNAAKAGDLIAIRITFILNQRGIMASRSKGNGKACCVNALRIIYLMDGSGALLEKTLKVSIGAWGPTGEAMDGALLQGIARVLHEYPEEFQSVGTLITKLSKQLPNAIMGRAKARMESGTTAKRIANAVIDIFNEGRRSGRLSLIV